MFTAAFIWIWQLSDRGAKDRRAIAVPDQVGLLLRAAFIDPLEPVIDWAYRAVWPDLAEEGAVGHFFGACIDRCGPFLCPVWSPAPAYGIGMSGLIIDMEEDELHRRCCVVAIKRLIADRVDQGAGHAQYRHKVVNAAVLAQASSH